MADDLRAGIEALIGDATIYHLVNGTSSQPEPARFVRVSDLLALLAAHPVQVTTAEDLDALPAGSVVACWYMDGSGPSVYARRGDRWRPGWDATGDGEGPYSSSNIMSGPDPRPLTVLYRPEVTT